MHIIPPKFCRPSWDKHHKKNYYPNDFRDLSKGRRLMETRLLIHEESGWKALEYVWNDEQTEAVLEVAGDTKKVSYVYSDGKKRTQQYSMPNLETMQWIRSLK